MLINNTVYHIEEHQDGWTYRAEIKGEMEEASDLYPTELEALQAAMDYEAGREEREAASEEREQEAAYERQHDYAEQRFYENR